jgi:phospholipid transport system substrate-binding protein
MAPLPLSTLLMSAALVLLATGRDPAPASQQGRAGAANATEPQRAVESLLDAMAVLGRKDAPRAEQEAARRAATGALDMPGIARFVLGKNWSTLTPKQRERFMATFERLLERRAFPKAGSFFEDVEMSFEDTRPGEGTARIVTAAQSPEEGRVEIEYLVRSLPGGPRIEDVILDGASLRLNLRSQILKVLQKDGFEALLTKMQEKIAESDAEKD